MRFFKVFVVLGTCFSFLHHVGSEDFCSQVYGDEVGLHTSYKDGKRSCCKIITCPAGSEAVMCRPDDPSSTYCQPCPPNTFQSDPTNSLDMKYCDAKQTCADGMKVEDDDSKVKDRRCLCDLEKGNCNPSRNRSTYCQRRNCPTGMGLNQDCSCTECPDGFFKDANGSMPCKPWRNCQDEGSKTVVEGTTTTDVVCSNRSDNRKSVTTAIVTTTALVTTASPESSSTSDLPAAHSMESSQTSSGRLEHTTLQNETAHNLTPIAIAIGILAVVVILVFIIVCLRRKIPKRCIYPPDKSCRPPERPPPAEVRTDVEVPLIPQPQNGQIVRAQHREGLPEREVIVPLHGGDTDRDDPQHQQGGSSNVERAAAATVEEDPHSMTCPMKETLRKYRVTVLKNLLIQPVFLTVLGINNTITDEMKETIQNEPTPSSRNDRLLDYLLRRPCLSYKTFVFALVYTSQLYLAQLINRDLAEEYEAYVKSGESVEERVRSFGCL